MLKKQFPFEQKDLQTSTEWKYSPAEMHALLTDEAFLRQPRVARPIFTIQADDTEYSKAHPFIVENNDCGQALIATMLKAYDFFKYGFVPKIIADTIRNDLLDRTYYAAGKNRPYIEWNNAMYFSALKQAVDMYADSFPIKTTTFTGIPITGFGKNYFINAQPFTPRQIDTLVTESQDIFAKGGMVVAFTSYLNGHFLLFTDIAYDHYTPVCFALDSRGPGDSPTPNGVIKRTALSSFYGEFGMLSAFGVYPTYTSATNRI